MWKHGAKVSHHLLMLTLLATLNALNRLLEMIKCSLLLIHAILHGVESSITDYCKLPHASAK